MVEYVGSDVSKEATAYCVKDEQGKVLARGKAAGVAEGAGASGRAAAQPAERDPRPSGHARHSLSQGGGQVRRACQLANLVEFHQP